MPQAELCRIARWQQRDIRMLAMATFAAGGCSNEKRPEKQESVEEASAPPPVDPPVSRRSTLSTSAPVQASPVPPPPVTPSREAQMQDDAEASGMTSCVPTSAENVGLLSDGNRTE